MKINFSLLLLLFVVIMGMTTTSCKKDKKNTPDPTPNNAFQYENKEYELVKAYQENYDENLSLNSFDVDLTLISSSLSYNAGTQDFDGKGDVIYLDLNTSVKDELVDGTYNFSSTPNAFTLVDGVVGINYDIKNEVGTLEDIIGGTVTLETIDGVQQAKFELVLSGNRKVTGFYKGNIIKI